MQTCAFSHGLLTLLPRPCIGDRDWQQCRAAYVVLISFASHVSLDNTQPSPNRPHILKSLSTSTKPRLLLSNISSTHHSTTRPLRLSRVARRLLGPCCASMVQKGECMRGTPHRSFRIAFPLTSIITIQVAARQYRRDGFHSSGGDPTQVHVRIAPCDGQHIRVTIALSV